ncbi:transcription elongation factor A protein 2-like [Branchiostoma floridae x Branchiostoma japonicum]
MQASLSTECRKVRPSCPETLTQEEPRTEDKCTECRNVRPSCPETLTQEEPRTEDKCTEGSGNEPPRLDGVRERCRQLLVQALETGTHNVQLVKDLATSIEDHIFCEFKNTGTKYKNRVRSRAANLKDPRNPELRRRLIQGEITPQQMATMSAQEMASDEVKKFRRQVSEESIQRRQVPHADGTMTDMFKCENCGRENCCYNQYRGFSADGPIASPFVFCMDCGNRWKFF